MPQRDPDLDRVLDPDLDRVLQQPFFLKDLSLFHGPIPCQHRQENQLTWELESSPLEPSVLAHEQRATPPSTFFR